MQCRRKQQMRAWSGGKDEQGMRYADVAYLIDLRTESEWIDPHAPHRTMYEQRRQAVGGFVRAHHEKDRQEHFPAAADPGKCHHEQPQQQPDHD